MPITDREFERGDDSVTVGDEVKQWYTRFNYTITLLTIGILVLVFLGGPVAWAISLTVVPGSTLWYFWLEYRHEGFLRRWEAVLSGALLLPSICAGIALFTVWSPREPVVVELLLAYTQLTVLVYFVARTVWSVREDLVELFRSR
jgi:hypothetical protein